MYRTFLYGISLMLLIGFASGEGAADEDEKLVSGMSIVGNDEAPKSLAIVPWKESRQGETLDFSSMLDDGHQPVDKDVFLRELTYYQIRVGSD